MGRFESYLGKTKIELDDEILELDITKEDKLKLLNVYRKDNEATVMNEIHDIIYSIMKKSYPAEPEEELKGMVEKRFEMILIELAINYKWVSRDKLGMSEKKK